MKHIISKHLLTVLMVFNLLLALMGCSSRTNDRDIILYDPNNEMNEHITLTFFGFKADALNLTAIEAALQGFMAENETIEISYEGIKGTAYYDALSLRIASDQLDDVFMAKQEYILSLGAEGRLADLSGLHGVDGFSDQAKEQFTNKDGSIYFLPTCISTYNLYINYDLLEAHGQEIPTNWEEFKQVCDYFAAQGIVPIIANNFASLPSIITGKGLFEIYQDPDVAARIECFNEDPALLAETLAPGVEMAAEMLERGWLDPAEVLVTQQTSDDLALFIQGDRPFMISGGWASVRVLAMNPEFIYGVHPYPILEDGSVLSMQVDTCIMVNASGDHVEEAKRFVEYLIQPDVMWAYCDSQDSYTPLREETRIPTEEPLAPSTEYLTNGRNLMRVDYRLTLPLETALQECVNVLLNGGTVTEAKVVLAECLSE